MRILWFKFACAVVLGLLVTARVGATAETLRAAGTGGAVGMMQQVATEFADATGIQLEIVLA